MRQIWIAMSCFVACLCGQTTTYLTGRLTGEGGQPVAGEVTAVMNSRGVRLQASPADSGGAFAVEVAAGTVLLMASADGYVSQQREISVVPGRVNAPVHFALAPAGSVSGRVVDMQGQAVPGARVWLSYRGEAAGGWRRAEEAGGDETDTAGRFTIPVVAQGKPFVLHAEGDGWLLSSSGTMSLRGPELQGVLLLLSRRGTSVSGRVVDEGGRPVPGAVVRLRAIPADGEFTAEQRALPAFARSAQKAGVTGSDGTFSFTGVPSGQVVITAQSGGRRGSVDAAVSVGAATRLDITMH
jgi:large repetitive protein